MLLSLLVLLSRQRLARVADLRKCQTHSAGDRMVGRRSRDTPRVGPCPHSQLNSPVIGAVHRLLGMALSLDTIADGMVVDLMEHGNGMRAKTQSILFATQIFTINVFVNVLS